MFTHGYIRWTSGFWWGGGGVLLCMGTWVHNYYTIHNVIHRRAADTGRAANFRRNHRRFKSTNFNVLYFPLLLPRMLLSKESRMQMAIAAWKEKKTRSILEAARVFEVPESTPSHSACWDQTMIRTSEAHINSHRLTETKEKSFIKKILDADKQGVPIQPEFLCGMAEILLHE